jgi:hypothetical protein
VLIFLFDPCKLPPPALSDSLWFNVFSSMLMPRLNIAIVGGRVPSSPTPGNKLWWHILGSTWCSTNCLRWCIFLFYAWTKQISLILLFISCSSCRHAWCPRQELRWVAAEGAQHFHFCDCFHIFSMHVVWLSLAFLCAYSKLSVICHYCFYAHPYKMCNEFKS